MTVTTLCATGNHPRTLRFGEDLPNKVRESRKASKRTSHSQFQYPRNKDYNQKLKGK